MSNVGDTVHGMTDSEVKPSDHIYSAIRSLRGWDQALHDSEGWSGNRSRTVGELLSAVLLAGGEERLPIAIAGKLDDDGTGSLAVLHADVVVIARAVTIMTDAAETTVSVHALREVASVDVRTRHTYYDGTDRYPRHFKIEVDVTVAGIAFTFAGLGYNSSELTSDDAVKAALGVLRARLAS